MKNMRAQGMQWRGRRPRRRVVVLGAPVVLLLSLLLTGLVLLRPTPAAHADCRDPAAGGISELRGSVISHQWSDDHGSTWSSVDRYTDVLPNSVNGENLFGTPAVVSDGDGTPDGGEMSASIGPSLVTNTYTTGANAWSGWGLVPGSIAGEFPFTFGHVSSR